VVIPILSSIVEPTVTEESVSTIAIIETSVEGSPLPKKKGTIAFEQKKSSQPKGQPFVWKSVR